jgi:hypothetical protein
MIYRRNVRDKKEKSTEGIKFHESFDFGHIQAECSNYLKSKRKVMKAT